VDRVEKGKGNGTNCSYNVIREREVRFAKESGLAFRGRRRELRLLENEHEGWGGEGVQQRLLTSIAKEKRRHG